MSEDKETLRKEFEQWLKVQPNGTHFADFAYTKLKNQAEEYEYRLDVKHKVNVEFKIHLEELKAELSRKEEMLTQEKAKAFDEGAKAVIARVNSGQKFSNPYRQDK